MEEREEGNRARGSAQGKGLGVEEEKEKAENHAQYLPFSTQAVSYALGNVRGFPNLLIATRTC